MDLQPSIYNYRLNYNYGLAHIDLITKIDLRVSANDCRLATIDYNVHTDAGPLNVFGTDIET